MNMPVSVHVPFRRRKSRAQRILETVQSALKVYTSMKVAQAGPKAAKQVAKGYAAAKGAKAGGKGLARIGRFVAIPAALVGAGVLVKRLTGNGSSEPASPSAESSAPVTPPAPPAASGPAGAPSMGEPGGLKSGTTTASPSDTTGEDGGSSSSPSPPGI